MSETLSVELVVQGVSEEILSNDQTQSSPILNLSQEESIFQNAHKENKTTFNFDNYNVNITQ